MAQLKRVFTYMHVVTYVSFQPVTDFCQTFKHTRSQILVCCLGSLVSQFASENNVEKFIKIEQ